MSPATEARLREEATNHMNGTKPPLEIYEYKKRDRWTESGLSENQVRILRKAHVNGYYMTHMDDREYKKVDGNRNSLRLLVSRGYIEVTGKRYSEFCTHPIKCYQITKEGKGRI